MRLLNADGSASEISGNGLRCLAAWIAHAGGQSHIEVETDAGLKRLSLLERDGPRFTFRAAMGEPDRDCAGNDPGPGHAGRRGHPPRRESAVRRARRGQRGATPFAGRRARRPPALSGRHERGAGDGRAARSVRILIWERGVGPTEASGTGACAAAVAAMQYGGAARDVQVASPGGTQRVEWGSDGLFLTGWAELIATAEWLGPGARLTRSAPRSRQLRRGLLAGRRAVQPPAPHRRSLRGAAVCRALLLPPLPLPPAAHRLAAILAMMVVLWMSEALPLAVTALVGPVLADRARRRAGAHRVRAVRRSDHLPVHRQLHAGRGDVRARAGSPHRLRRAVVACGQRQRRSHPHRLRPGRRRDLDVDQQHGDDRHDVSDRPVDRGAPDGGEGVERGQPRVRDRDDADDRRSARRSAASARRSARRRT